MKHNIIKEETNKTNVLFQFSIQTGTNQKAEEEI